jgi:hypothetical protein
MITCPHCGGDLDGYDLDDDPLLDAPVLGPEPAPARVAAWANAASDDEGAVRATCERVAARLVEQCPDGFALSGEITFTVQRRTDEEQARAAQSWLIDHQMLHGTPPPPGTKAPRLVRVLGEAPIAMQAQP